MKLITIVENILLESPLDDAVNKYVGEGKPISNEIYSQITDASQGKTQFVLWLMMRILDNSISPDSISKFKNILEIFEKYKNFFHIKDLSQIKTKSDIDRFLLYQANRINSILKKNTVGGSNYINGTGIINLNFANIYFHGIKDGYQLFEVPNDSDTEESYDEYSKYFGKCKNRNSGEVVSLCTIAEFDSFKKYLRDYYGSSYYVLYNLSDPSSPYQFHFESSQFKNKDNKEIDIKSFPETIQFITQRNPELLEYTMSDEEFRYGRFLRDENFVIKITMILNFFNKLWENNVEIDQILIDMEDSFNERINRRYGGRNYGQKGTEVINFMEHYYKAKNNGREYLIDTLSGLSEEITNDWEDDNTRRDPRESVDYVLDFIDNLDDYL